jgi:gliding motility-associated-like protein
MRNFLCIRIFAYLSLLLLILPGFIVASTEAGSFYNKTFFSINNLTEPGNKSFPVMENPFHIGMDQVTVSGPDAKDLFPGCTDDTAHIFKSGTESYLVAIADYDTTLVNTPVTLNVLENDINPEGDPLIVSLCQYPSHGIVVLNSDKSITYTPYTEYQGDDFLCYRICNAIKPTLCADTLVYIHVKLPDLNDLLVYNGVSPNGDGNNDTWKIRGIEKYPDNTILIYNRWGDKVREFANYNNTTRSWDGKNEHGEPLPNGTYFYMLEVKNVGILKGWIFIRGGK